MTLIHMGVSAHMQAVMFNHEMLCGHTKHNLCCLLIECPQIILAKEFTRILKENNDNIYSKLILLKFLPSFCSLVGHLFRFSARNTLLSGILSVV